MLLLSLLGCREAPAPEPPDVLLVVIDTLRADRTSVGGHSRRTTPQLAALGDAGVVYTDTTAPGSWTWPSHASLFTGEPPWVHGAHFAPPGPTTLDMGKNRLAMTPMRTDLPTLAERLGAAGWRTTALVENSFLDPTIGLTRGFSRAEVIRDDIVGAALAEIARPGRVFLFLNIFAPHAPYVASPAAWSAARRAELTPAQARSWAQPYLAPDALDLTRGSPFRAWDLYARGELFIPPEGLDLLLDLYDGEVAAADVQLRAVVDAWTRSGRQGIVIVTSDHGEYFGEHGLLEHGRTVWREVTHVPLVVAAPGRLAGARRVDAPVQLQDVYPTVLELAGLEDPAWSLVDAAAGVPRPGPVLAAEWPDVYKAEVAPVYRTGWRLYREGDDALVFATDGSRTELYDLGQDPRMRRDRAAEDPAAVARLRALAADAYPEAPLPPATGSLSAESIEVLKAMGYVE